MAKSDFFRNIPVHLASELEALSRLQYDLREARKNILAHYEVAELDALYQAIAQSTLSPLAAMDAVRCAVMADEQQAVHAALSAHMTGVESDVISTHARIIKYIDKQCGDRYPGGATQRFDALELLDIEGIAHILHIAAPDCWATEWGEDDGNAQYLLRLPQENLLCYCSQQGQWHKLPAEVLAVHSNTADLFSLTSALLALDMHFSEKI